MMYMIRVVEVIFSGETIVVFFMRATGMNFTLNLSY